MSAFPPREETWMVTLECLSHLSGPRFLDGRVADGSVGLAPHTGEPFSGTWWAVVRLAPNVVKFRCMTQVQGPRFLDGRPTHGEVRMRPMLASPPSGEWWSFVEQADGSVTLQSLSKSTNPNHRFLDGRTQDASVGLAPHTSSPFSGTHWRVVNHGRIAVLQCEGKAIGNRYLDGRLLDGTTALAPMAMGRFTGTRWLLRETGRTAEGSIVTLKCLGELGGENRFLDGVLLESRVALASTTAPPFTGTQWEMIEISNPHADVEPGFLATFKCLGAVQSDRRFLDGILQSSSIGLAPHTGEPFSGTLWRVLPAGPFFEPCPRAPVPPFALHTLHTTGVVRTIRIGQLTGSVDPEGRPLINGNTGVLGIPGIDLGATAEDGHGRLFIFFGDVVRGDRKDGPDIDADAVAFTTDSFVEERLADFPGGGGGGIRLSFVMGRQFFDPFTVSGPIDTTLTFEVPSGAFSHAGKMFVFFHIWNRQRKAQKTVGCYIASKTNPGQPGPFTEECLFSPRVLPNGALGSDSFAGVAPVKVLKSEHPWLPNDPEVNAEEGLVMFGLGNSPFLGGYSAIHLAWMPLVGDTTPLNKVRYLANLPNRWNPQAEECIALFGKQTNLQSISAAYLKGPQKWIVVYMTSNNTDCPTGPIMARIGTPPFDWSEEFRLFDPCRERAYGKYMHWPDLDPIQMDDPFRGPLEHPTDENERRQRETDRADKVPGNAYGAFLLDRFTRWDAQTRTLDLYYLLSLFSPYQVQLMHTTLRLAGPR